MITSITITSDDQRLACGLSSGKIFVYSLKHKTCNFLDTKSSAALTCIQFYPFKKNIIVAGNIEGSVFLFDINTKEIISSKLKIHSAPVSGIS